MWVVASKMNKFPFESFFHSTSDQIEESWTLINNAVDFYGESSDDSIYEVRSGIEFMLKLFKNISGEFDTVLNNIETYASIEDEFDKNLKLWQNSS